jgi:hypothetical protein
MRKVLLMGMILSLPLFLGLSDRAMAEEGHEHEHGGHEHAGGGDVTIKGELVDSLCYVGMKAKGPGHKQCAIDCAKAGIPVSILEDGTGKLYTVLPSKDKTGLPETVISKMGDKVTLKGDLYENGGNRYVTAESVE